MTRGLIFVTLFKFYRRFFAFIDDQLEHIRARVMTNHIKVELGARDVCQINLGGFEFLVIQTR